LEQAGRMVEQKQSGIRGIEQCFAAAGIVLDPGGNRGDYLFGGPELSNVISKPGFYVSRFVKTALKQHSKSRLGRGAPQRGEERVPLGRDLRVGRQTVQVDQALRFCDRLFVERRNPHSKGVNKRVELGVP